MGQQLLQRTQEGAAATSGPNCWQCKSFAITWDPGKPYGCNLMGFKSRLLPSLEVLRADGQMCRGFMAKAPPVKAVAAQALTLQTVRSVVSTTRHSWEA